MVSGNEAVTVEQVARALGVPAPAPPLPAGYTRLEYIEGTGTQYIDTGYFPCELTRVVTAITPTSGNSTNGVFGGRTDNNVSTFSLWCINGVYRTDFDGASHVTTTVSVSGRIEVDKDRGTTKLGSKTFTQTGKGFRSANSMHVFAVNPDKNGPRCFRGRIETFSIYESGLLEHELVPARRDSDGAVGMYDTVAGSFLANSGSGAFKAGPEVASATVDGAEGAAVTLKQFKVASSKLGGGGEQPPETLTEVVLYDGDDLSYITEYPFALDVSKVRSATARYRFESSSKYWTYTYTGEPTGTHWDKQLGQEREECGFRFDPGQLVLLLGYGVCANHVSVMMAQ